MFLNDTTLAMAFVITLAARTDLNEIKGGTN